MYMHFPALWILHERVKISCAMAWQIILCNKCLNEDELKVYDKKFQAIGILDKEEQKKILEFFYTLGVITFNL